MSDLEILITDVDTTNFVYFVIYDTQNNIANRVAEAFEVVADANWSEYDIEMTELGTNTNTYRGDFPAWITTGGQYYFVAYEQLDTAPQVSDDVLATGSVNWTGSAIATNVVPAAEGDLFTLAEYKTWKGITSTDATRDATIEYLIDAVSNAIKKYLDRSVVAAVREEIYHANGAFWLHVNNYPITSVSSITFDYGSDNPEAIDGGEFVFIVDGNNGTIMFNPNSNFTRRFTGHVKVQYAAGYTEADRPEDLKLAGMMWLEKLYSKRTTGTGKVSESLGDYSYTLASGSETLMIPAEVEMLLKPYKAPPLL